MGEGFPVFVLPLITLGAMGAVFVAIGAWFRAAGDRLVEEPGVVVVHADADILAVRWGGPDLDEHVSVPLPSLRRLDPGERVTIRHRPGETSPVELLGPLVRGTPLFVIGAVTLGVGAALSLVVLLTG